MQMLTRLLFGAAVAAFLLMGSPTAHAQPARPSLTGTWSGSIGPIEFIVHLLDPATGARTATLDIPAQRVQGQRMTFTAPGDSVYLAVANVKFVARRSADNQQLVGEWQQSLRVLPLTLSRAADGAAKPAAAALRRPQTPQPPFPYQAAEVTFKNEKANVTLAGTFTVPAGKSPFPAVVLLTGSGPEDRNSTILGHQPFAVLADYLTRHGIAVLRFDDRGVGQSGGSLASASTADYTTDAQAALTWLRAQPGIVKNRVGLVGHSSGGTAAIGAATQPGGPDGLVLLAAPGLPGDEMMVQQSLALTRLQTTDAAQLAAVEKACRSVYRIIQQTPDDTQARAQILALSGATPTATPAEQANVEQELAKVTSSEFRHILADHPAQTLVKVRCPVLALNGSKDVQVVAAPNLAAIAAALKAGGNRDVTVKELPGLNHLFQTATTGGPAEYGTLEETFAPAALQLIGDWLTQHLKR